MLNSSSSSGPAGRGAVLRATLITAATVAATGLLGRSALAAVDDGELRLDDAVGAVVLGVAALAAGVMSVGFLALTVSTTARSLGGSLRAADAAARRLTPAVMRRVVTAGLGVGLGLGTAVSAHAAEPDQLWVVTDQPGVSAAAAEAPSGTAPAGAAGLEAEGAGPEGREPVSAPPSDAGARGHGPSGGLGRAVGTAHVPGSPDDGTAASDEVEVRLGDSLWSIAAAHLGPDATDGEIAREWPRWYEANRETIGGDPDHVVPGQLLAVPSGGDR